MKNFIEYDIFFRAPLKANEDIIFDNLSEKYIEKVTIFKGDQIEEYPKRRMRIDFKSEELSLDILKNIDNFILEFLHKLTLHMRTLFPFYKEILRKIGDTSTIEDSIGIIDKLIVYEKISNDKTVINEDIRFTEHLENYKKMIRILGIAESDPVTTFLILYDWFLAWVNFGNNKLKQKEIVEYLRNHKTELEKNDILKYEFQFHYNEEKKCDEDDFTKLRNDIAHSYERIGEEEFPRIEKRTRYLLKPLVYVMTYFLKNK